MSREAFRGAVPGEAEGQPAAKPAARSRVGAGTTKRPSLGGGRPAQDRELRAQGRQTVRRLLEAGLAEFDERGFQAVRVDDIVRRARTSHGTFYLYFANKDDFFKALLRDALHDMGVITDAFPVVTRNDAGRAALRQWVHTFCETYAAHAAVIRILSQAELVGEEVWGDGLQLLFRLAEAITQGMTAAAPHGLSPTPAEGADRQEAGQGEAHHEDRGGEQRPPVVVGRFAVGVRHDRRDQGELDHALAWLHGIRMSPALPRLVGPQEGPAAPKAEPRDLGILGRTPRTDRGHHRPGRRKGSSCV